MVATNEADQYPIMLRKFSSDAKKLCAASIATGIRTAVVIIENVARGARVKIGRNIYMFSAMEYVLMAIFPITESARMTATNLPNPPAGDSIAVTIPPTELAR